MAPAFIWARSSAALAEVIGAVSRRGAAAGGRMWAALFQDGRHEEPLVVALRGVGQGLLAGEGRDDHVGAEDVADLDAVGERLDARRVGLLELGDEVDDRVELPGEQRQLVR